MKKQSYYKSPFVIIFIIAVMVAVMLSGCVAKGGQEQKKLSISEYLEETNENWFLTGKKKYTIQAMMTDSELSFHNELEDADYSVTDDAETVVLKGTRGEMWTSPLSKVICTYTKPDGCALCEADFSDRGTYIDIVTIPALDSNYAMFVPEEVSVTVETAWGDTLHTNLDNAPHGKGDYLVCNVGGGW